MRYLLVSVLVVSLIVVLIIPTAAQDSEIPAWIKNNAGWWATDTISETEFINAITYLIKVGIVIIETSENYKQIVQNPMELLDDLSFLEQTLFPGNISRSEHLTNSYGFRGTEISESKPSDTYRIFMVGGLTNS